MTELNLQRDPSTSDSTIGVLSWPDGGSCLTLEDVVRLGDIFIVKLPGKTAIPAGRYQVIINMSKRFKKLMPLLLAVPNFEGIRIHSGNRSTDTEGCIILGKTRDDDFIGMSRVTVTWFTWKLRHALTFGPVHITIRNAS